MTTLFKIINSQVGFRRGTTAGIVVNIISTSFRRFCFGTYLSRSGG